MQPLSKAKLRFFAALNQKKYRYQHACLMVEGEKMVEEALRTDWPVKAVVLREDKRNLWENRHIKSPLFVATAAQFAQLTRLQHPEGIVAVLGFPQPDFSRQALGVDLPPGPGFILDAIQDPGNLGTILRIADWFGLPSVICGPGTVDPLNPKALRSSMGAIFRVGIFQSKDLPTDLKAHQAQVWLSHMDGTALPRARLGLHDYFVIGNEANGLSDVWTQVDSWRKLVIPGQGRAESLNAAIAAGILAWELHRQCFSSAR